MTARELHRAQVMARDRYACALAPQRTGWPGEDSEAGPCTPIASRPVLQADHILKVSALLRYQAQLRRRTPRELTDRQRVFIALTEDDLAADARNGWLLCLRHHGLKDARRLIIVEEVILPDEFALFVADFELANLVERELRPRPVPGFPHGVRNRSGAAGAPRRGI